MSSGSEVRYPDCVVRLIGTDGNAFAILGLVRRSLSAAGASASELSEFMEEATSGDYDALLSTVMRWVEVE